METTNFLSIDDGPIATDPVTLAGSTANYISVPYGIGHVEGRMLFRQRTLEGIAAGTVTLTYRRWDRPRSEVGSETRTSVGVVVIDSIDAVDLATVTEPEALAAGYGSLYALQRELTRDNQRHPDGTVFRIGVRLGGPDPRVALRADAELDGPARAEITKRLDRLDAASRHGPWTRRVLELIRDRPATRAADLAADEGRETQPFKIDVRKLKNLGLTESLDVGYRISPRGRAFLASP